MSNRSKRQAGFSASIIIIAIVIVAVAGIGFVVFKKSSNAPSASVVPSTSPSVTQPANQSANAPENTINPYEEMTQYTNDKYGISFYYPKEWRVEELANDKPTGAVPAEFVISLKADVNEKYNDTLVLQVVAKSFEEIKNFYVNEANKSAIAKDTKQDGNEKGKRSTHVTTVVPDTSRSERYLFDVKGKTYMVESTNEILNIQRDSEYWKKFNTVYQSLELR